MKKKSKKAIALKYDTSKNNAPKVIAKGKGEVAKKIIEIAKKSKIPIKEDHDLTEMLSKIEIDEQIPPKLYQAVAEVFKFIYKITK